MAIPKGLSRAVGSLRARLTLLMVGLLVCCCVVLTLLVYHSTTVVLEVAALQPAQQGGLSIQLDADGIKRTILSDALIVLALVVIAGSGAAYLVAGRYTRPIQQLSARMREMELATLSQPIEVEGGGGEIQELVRSFNQMTGQLSEAFAMQRRFSASAAQSTKIGRASCRERV